MLFLSQLQGGGFVFIPQRQCKGWFVDWTGYVQTGCGYELYERRAAKLRGCLSLPLYHF